MLTLRFVWVGKNSDEEYARGIARYLSRLAPWAKSQEVVIRAERDRSPEAARREGERVLKAVSGRQRVAVLDERGRSRNSEEFARWLSAHRDRDPRPLSFVVGGASGLSPEVRKRADDCLSLSAMTFPHQLARLVLVEQVYRALSIDAGLRYH